MTCTECDGKGGVLVDSMTLYGIPGGEDWARCPTCKGTGTAPTCPECGAPLDPDVAHVHHDMECWDDCDCPEVCAGCCTDPDCPLRGQP